MSEKEYIRSMNKELIFRNINNILWNDFITDKLFFEKFQQVELYCIKNGLNGLIYEYNFPDKNKSKLSIYASEAGIEITLNCDNKQYVMGKERNAKQLYDAGELIKTIMLKNKLLYSPKVTKEFIAELNQIHENEIVDFNTRLSVVCLENSTNKLILKKQFEGKMDSISVKDFQNSETFVLDKNNADDYQILFGYAYDYRSNTCNIRRRLQSKDGYNIIHDIESKMKNNDVFYKNIGPIQLKIIKSNDECVWYDTNNERICKDDLATVFSWVKNIDVDYNVVNLENGIQNISTEVQNQVNLSYLQMIKQNTNDISKIISMSFELNRLLKYTSISISGLREDDSHNFDSCTFVFTQGKIIKIDYFYGSFSNNDIKAFVEIKEEEFVSFMKQKRDNIIKEVNLECKQEYDDFVKSHPNFTKEEAQELIAHITARKIELTKNVYNLSMDKINHLDVVTEKLIQNYLSNVGTQNLSIKDLLSENIEQDEINDDKELL